MTGRYADAVTFRFGDGPELNADILALVRAGCKTVSCDALAAYEARGEALPEVGRVDVALDWAGVPQLALRTVAVDLIRFDEMSEALVADQGEFSDLEDWRRGYRAYLERSGHYAPDAVMVVDRFELVEELSDV